MTKQIGRAVELLKAFGAPISYITDAPQGEDRTRHRGGDRQGVMHVGAELGGGGTLDRAACGPRKAGSGGCCA